MADRRAEKLLFLALLAASSVVFINVCDLVFACGCDSLWNGAAQRCNIHQATARHCPWCEHPLLGGGVAFFSVLLAQAGLLLWPGRLGLGTRIMLAAAALPTVGGAVGLLQGWLWGYWG